MKSVMGSWCGVALSGTPRLRNAVVGYRGSYEFESANEAEGGAAQHSLHEQPSSWSDSVLFAFSVLMLGRFALLLPTALGAMLSPGGIEYSNELRGVLIELGLAALAAELHETVANDTLKWGAHRAELALVANNAGLERIVLCL